MHLEPSLPAVALSIPMPMPRHTSLRPYVISFPDHGGGVGEIPSVSVPARQRVNVDMIRLL